MKTSTHRYWPYGALLALGLAAPAAQAQPADPEKACEQLTTLQLDKTEIVSADAVSSGPRVYKMPLFGGIPWLDLPASCRVAGIIRPVPGSEIRFEVWMPQQGWNGKFQGIGAGGLAGGIETMFLGIALQGGYAAASTDTGHEADGDDGRWALNNPEKITDYGHRGIHEMTVRAKAVIAAYYGKPAQRNYFSSCSNGGRQGLMEAQRYPADYDGIMAGAPALDGTGTIPSWGWYQQVIRAAPDGLKLKNKLELIEDSALAACDAKDGIKDGILDDPRRCDFKPQSLLCKSGQDEAACLSATQVDVLVKLFTGPGPLGGTENYGNEPGGITGLTGWAGMFDGWWGKSGMYNYVLEFMRYLTYHDANWQFSQFDFRKDRLEMQKRIGGVVDATNPDLSAFIAHGGKLLMYHGWSDIALPPRTSIRYYERVQEKVGPKANDAVQLFMAPGVHHCIMGPGPNVIGQMRFGQGQSADNNVHAALEQWVEKGMKPVKLIASKYDNDIRGLLDPASTTLLRSRPLCAYPQVARYKGKGSTDDAANFECKAP